MKHGDIRFCVPFDQPYPLVISSLTQAPICAQHTVGVLDILVAELYRKFSNFYPLLLKLPYGTWHPCPKGAS